MVMSSFKPNAEIFESLRLLPRRFYLGNFVDVFRFQPFARHYFNSFYIAVTSTALTILLCSLSGYAFARLRFRGSNLLFVTLLSALMMPAEVTIIPTYFLMSSLGFIDTHIPLIFVPVFGMQGAVVTFLMRQYFITVPLSLTEAPRIDGLGEFGIFVRIMMPLARSVTSAAVILTFLNNWNLFLEPLIFIHDLRLFTLPLSLNNFTDPYGLPVWNLQLTATALAAVPILIVYVVFQRQIENAMVFSALKG
ncbi:MAG: carbohydrate ABC transporter permease [Spirochaetaceae bacterium]|nr:MAG: carbohydrate ABC transporter permease [Spirochaetaceae bacterium]